jgi:hypothetical protein
MLKRVTHSTALMVAFLSTGPKGLAASEWTSRCGPSSEKGWVEFVDQTNRFCFWYPPKYNRKAADAVSVHWPTDRHILASLISSEPLHAHSDDKEPATIEIYVVAGVFSLKRLISDAPTGYDTPPTPKHFGANVFYYYGPGGGGVAYPDKYYFNLRGRALQIVFDGTYPGDGKSPNAETRAVEKVILSSFKAAER